MDLLRGNNMNVTKAIIALRRKYGIDFIVNTRKAGNLQTSL